MNVCIDFSQTDNLQQPHDRLINLQQIVSKLIAINYTSTKRNVGPKCFVNMTFSRKGPVFLVQNRTGVNFRTRTKFTEPTLQLLNIPWYGHLQFHLHITVIYPSLCKVETATKLLKCFVHLCQSVYDKRHVLKPIHIAEVESFFGI